MIRLQKDIGQEKLHELSGVPTISIRKYESGDRTPKIEQVIKIANALNVDPFTLITAESYPDEYYKKWLESSEPIYKYLDSLGYKVELEQEEFKMGDIIGKKATGNVLLISKAFGTTEYSKKDFEGFKKKIKESIDYLVWQKQQSNRKELDSAATENCSK